MDDYVAFVRKTIQYTIFLLSFFFLGWAMTGYKTVFAGLILGASISLFNSIYTSRKIHRLGEMVHSGRKKAAPIGTVTRFGTSVLAGLIAMRYPQTFDLISTIIGLMAAQTIALFGGALQHFSSTSDRRGKG